MAYYANENFDKFIPEKDIKDQILKEKPVSANTDPVRTIDSWLWKSVEGRQELTNNKELEYFKQRSVIKWGL